MNSCQPAHFALQDHEALSDAQEQLPPKLLTEGARVDPDWMLALL